MRNLNEKMVRHRERVIEPNEMKSAVFPEGLTVLIAGNFLWENRTMATIIESYFPESIVHHTAHTGLIDVLNGDIVYDLVILDEMIVCGDQWVEIFHALNANQPVSKIVVYGTKFSTDSAFLRKYPSLVDQCLPKDMVVEELVYQLSKVFKQ